MRNSHQPRLNPVREINRVREMVIGFETVNATPARIVEVNAHEYRILLCVFDRDALFERNENVGRARHHDFHVRRPQLSGETIRDIERGDFLRAVWKPNQFATPFSRSVANSI